MSRKRVFFVILLGLTVLMTGCEYDPGGSSCDPGELTAPEISSPGPREVVTGSHVSLAWDYPDESCEPENYQIILARTADFNTIDLTGETGDSSTTWSPPGALDPATEYFWRVAAMSGTTVGPFSNPIRSFFTEPVCDPGTLTAPVPEAPDLGKVYNRGSSSLEWSYPDSSCIPESYRVELSPDREFTDTSLFGATGSPATRWGPGDPLEPATLYYWRVAAFADGVLGPFSRRTWFVTDPVCPGGGVSAPELGLLPDGSEVDTDTPMLGYSHPDPTCTPEGVRIELSTAPDLSSHVMLADNPNTMSSAWIPEPLNDCQTYYWRAAFYSDGTMGPYSEIRSFSVDLTDGCTCDPSNLPQPVLSWPGQYEIISELIPVLDWNNPGPCSPDSYQVQISTWHDFSDTSLFGATGAPDTSWTPADSLDPATQYYWKVAPTAGGDLGPFSSTRSFFTGPECSYVGTVGTPERLAPADGTMLDSLTAVLHYRPGGDPGCIPDGYFLNLQTDPAFGGTNLLTEYGIPATTVITDPLVNCERYFWTVTAVQDGSRGPASDVGWFDTNEGGLCPLRGMPGMMRKNTFCREGTYPEYFDAVHTFEEGDYVEAVAQNPYGTYLQVYVPGPDGLKPPDPLDKCWIPQDSALLWGDFQALSVVVPPDPPEEEGPVCRRDLNQTECEAAGGTWTRSSNTTAVTYYCECP
jgi:hypothetical protein